MGRKEFEKVTAISANPSYNMRYVQASVLSPVGVGETVEISVFATAGTVAEVQNLYLMWQKLPSATSGDRLILGAVANSLIGFLWAIYPFGSDIYYRYGQFEGTPTTKYPDTSIAQVMQQKISYDQDDGITFKFTNQTNVADSGLEKRVRLWVKETKII